MARRSHFILLDFFLFFCVYIDWIDGFFQFLSVLRNVKKDDWEAIRIVFDT